MEEINEMDAHFEPADQHISVRITSSEKRKFIQWCRDNRLSKSQGIRKLITDRLIKPEKVEKATSDITHELEELKRAISEIKTQLKEKPKQEEKSWGQVLDEVLVEKVEKVPANRLAKKQLNKQEIATLTGFSVKTLANMKRYVYDSGEEIFPFIAKVNNKGIYDCSKVTAETFPERFQVDINWDRLEAK